jgi:hypothetical protein
MVPAYGTVMLPSEGTKLTGNEKQDLVAFLRAL